MSWFKRQLSSRSPICHHRTCLLSVRAITFLLTEVTPGVQSKKTSSRQIDEFILAASERIHVSLFSPRDLGVATRNRKRGMFLRASQLMICSSCGQNSRYSGSPRYKVCVAAVRLGTSTLFELSEQTRGV